MFRLRKNEEDMELVIANNQPGVHHSVNVHGRRGSMQNNGRNTVTAGSGDSYIWLQITIERRHGSCCCLIDVACRTRKSIIVGWTVWRSMNSCQIKGGHFAIVVTVSINIAGISGISNYDDRSIHLLLLL
jgi:hypothetical protein